MNILTRLSAAAGFALLAGTAQAQMDHGAHGGGGMDMRAMMDAMMPAEGDTASTKAFKEADMKMMRDMAVPYTGNADVDFRLKMIPHHQGAIDMAKVALEHATDAETRAMAEQIIAAQEKEIADMRAWLEKHGH